MDNLKASINNMSIRMREGKRYEGRLTINGKRKSFYGITKAEVKQKARDYLMKVQNGYRDPKKITLNEYMEYWLKEYKWTKIEETSYTRLYRVYEHQIKGTIGKKQIGSITTKDIQTLIDNYANPPSSDIKPLAKSGLKKIKHLLEPCLKMAVKEGIISESPFKDITLPVEECMAVSTKEQFSLNDKEIEELRVEALRTFKSTNEYKTRNGLGLLLIINLGLRIGEALALEWDDIDWEANLVHINKIVQYDIQNFDREKNHGKAKYCKTKHSSKTKAGVRVLKLNEMSLLYLREMREYDKRNNIQSKYVICTLSGGMSSPRNMQKSLDVMIQRTDIEGRVTLHTLRHTFGSTLLRRGVGIEVVSKLMGHANITITYNKYIHVIQEQEAKAMEMINIC